MADVGSLRENPHTWVVRRDRVQHRARVVRRAVVGDEDLEVSVLLAANGLHRPDHGVRSVVGGNPDGDQGPSSHVALGAELRRVRRRRRSPRGTGSRTRWRRFPQRHRPRAIGSWRISGAGSGRRRTEARWPPARRRVPVVAEGNRDEHDPPGARTARIRSTARRGFGISLVFVEANVFQRGDRQHQVVARRGVQLEDVRVVHAGRLLVLVDDIVAHTPVVRQHVAHLEHAFPSVSVHEMQRRRDFDRTLVAPRHVVRVGEVAIAAAIENEFLRAGDVAPRRSPYGGP